MPRSRFASELGLLAAGDADALTDAATISKLIASTSTLK